MSAQGQAHDGSLQEALTQVGDRLQGSPYVATAALVEMLHRQRSALGTPGWLEAVDAVRRHPLLELTHEDPFTRRAFSKPRGYPGDAVLIDHIYGAAAPEFQHPIGKAINRFTTSSPATRGVRFRRHLLAELIDRASAEGHGHCRVLALACGHLRELELSQAVRRGDTVDVVALDQDPASIEVARQLHCRLQGHTASIKTVLKRSIPLHDFDLVYAASLFDYLDDKVATLLLTRMLEATRPGGRVLVANFVPDIPDVGYMEACMDWFLKYRTEPQLRALLADIPPELKGPIRTFHDPDDDISFLIVTRPGE